MQQEDNYAERPLPTTQQNGTEQHTSTIPQSSSSVNVPVPEQQSISSLGAMDENKKWAKQIPNTNLVFMIISLVLVFGLDLIILISSPDLLIFFIAMIVVLAIFGVFFYLENFIFKKRFASSISSLDNKIIGLIWVRNIIFVLNFIPLIQLIGWLGISVLGAPLLVIYIILIIRRRDVAQSN